MIFEETPLAGAYVIRLKVLSDERGRFARTFCKKEFEKINHHKEFVQFNHSYNSVKGTLRGMHFQKPPFSEIKLIRCVRGKVFDTIVDLRKESSTFLKHFSIELSENELIMLYVPERFAHGFQTLEDNSELIYHHTEYYTPNVDAGIRYDDPALKLDWPLPPVMVSEKDKSYPLITNNFKGF